MMKRFLNWLGPSFALAGVGAGLTVVILVLDGHDWLLWKLWVGLGFGLVAVTLAALNETGRRRR